MGANQLTFLEELEPRIAPATFVMGADGSTITGVGADANLADHQTVDAKIAGYADASEGFAFLFKKGDKLVFDTNENLAADKTEPVVLSVTAGAALVFFTDHDNDDSTAFAITGVAMGDKFSGVINADVHGSLFTALGTDGHLSYVTSTYNPSLPGNATIDIQNASISNVTVNGFVEGAVFVGGSISGLKITGTGAESTGSIISTPGIYTGTATMADNNSHLSVGTRVSDNFIYDKAGVGGSISNVEIAGGVKKILAGDGVLSDADATNPKAKALAGGSISNVTVQSRADLADDVFFSLEVRAGQGSEGATQTDPLTSAGIAGSAGGAGGSISKLTVKYGSVGQLTVHAGDGGHGGFNAAGGAGGAISTLSASTVGAAVFAGDGGNAGFFGKNYEILDEGAQFIMTSSAAAGVGGSVTGVTLVGMAPVGEDRVEVPIDSGSGMDIDSNVGIFAGHGGAGGAAGGSVSKTALAGTYFDEVSILAGNGSDAYAGTGKAGGASGAIAGVTLKNLEIRNLGVGFGDREDFDQDYSGPAGMTVGGNGAEKITLKPVVVEGDTFYSFAVTGGGAGGAGGGISGIVADSLAPGQVSNQFIAYGAFGGNGAYLGNGGAGGAISNVSLPLQGDGIIQAGYGGSGGVVTTEYALSDSETVVINLTGAGGAGGSVSQIGLKAVGLGASTIQIFAGFGSGYAPGGGPTGGAGGHVAGVAITGNQVGLIYIGSGVGGLVSENSGRAGSAGGNVSNVAVTLDTLGAFLVNAGEIDGGFGSDGAQKVTVSKIKNSEFYKATYVGTAGGAGGSVSGVTLQVASVIPVGEMDVALVAISAGDGGRGSSSEGNPVAGNGGAGGKVEKIVLNAVYDKKSKTWNPKDADHLVAAVIEIGSGAGGDGKVAGAGGAINEVRMFTKDSEIEIFSGEGGDSYETAGAKDGAGGNISNLTVISAASGPGYSSLTIEAGDGGRGGDGNSSGLGAAGGSISNLYDAAAYDIELNAGRGSAGTTGGAGGSITGANLFSKLTPVGNIEVSAGSGGDGTSGAGGAGGSVSKVIGDSSAYVDNLPEGGIVPPEGSVSVNEDEGYTGDLIISDTVSGAYLQGGSIQEPDLDTEYFQGNGSEDTLADVEISEDSYTLYVYSEADYQINDLLISGNVYGNIQFRYSGGTIAGDVTITGQVDRIVLNEDTRIEGDLTITGPNNGVWIRIGEALDPEDPEWITYTTVPLEEYAPGLAGIVDGAFSNTGAELGSWDLPEPTWQNVFTGNVTFENGVYGPTYLSGRIDGDVTFMSDVYAPIYLTVNSFGNESDPISTSIGGDLILPENHAGVFVQSITWNEWGEEALTIEIIPLSEWLEEDYYGLEILGEIENLDSEPFDGFLIQPWQVSSYNLEVKAGDGGDGYTQGGAGGSVSASTFNSDAGDEYFEAAIGFEGEWRVEAGDGGNGDSDKSTSVGGAGGSIASVNLSQYSPNDTEESPIQMVAGDGGDGEAKGGVGGSITKSAIIYTWGGAGVIEIEAGNGGSASGAAKSAAGAGGSISGFSLKSTSPASFEAGSAGETGAVGAVGGSISTVQFQGFGAEVSFRAGDGGAGGAGGSIDKITELGQVYFDGDAQKWLLAPSFGNLTFIAGNGSFGGGVSGAGGSIKNVTVVAPDEHAEHSLTAGNGADGTKPGVGGTIENIQFVDRQTSLVKDYETGKFAKQTGVFDFERIGFQLGAVTLLGGAGGNNSGSGAGAKGGDVKNVQWNLDTLSRFLAAGQGGSGTPDGATGAVANVNAPYSDPS